MQRAVQPRNGVPTPVVTSVVRSPPAARTPTTPPPAVKPSAPATSFDQHPSRRNRQQRAFGHIAAVHMRGRNVVDDVDHDRAGGAVALGVGHRVAEAVLVLLGLRRRCRAVRRRVERRGQRIGVGPGRGVQVPACRGCRSPALVSAKVYGPVPPDGVIEPLKISLFDAASLPITGSPRLVHQRVGVGRRQRHVGKVDRQRRRRQVAVAVLDRVDKHVGGVRRDVVRRRLVGVAAVRIQNAACRAAPQSAYRRPSSHPSSGRCPPREPRQPRRRPQSRPPRQRRSTSTPLPPQPSAARPRPHCRCPHAPSERRR